MHDAIHVLDAPGWQQYQTESNEKAIELNKENRYFTLDSRRFSS